MNIISKKVLGLRITINSIGFYLNKIFIENEQTIFEEIASNSIIFSEYIKAADRKSFRSGRRRNERNSRRKEIVRKLLCDFNFANKSIITQPIEYFNNLSKNQNPYILKQSAVQGKSLTKDEFTFALYTTISRRGYSNQFNTKDTKNDGVINGAISKNKAIYLENNLAIPSLVLWNKKIELENDGFINVSIRNKKDNYNNSLDRELWQEELEKLLESQKNNSELFEDKEKYETFKNKLLHGVNENSLGIFEQRPLKSMEDMVGYCSFYNAYHQNSQKRVAKAHISSIEFTLRQRIENSILGNLIFNDKTGDIFTPTKKDIENTIEFWLKNTLTQTINTRNIFDKAGLKNIKIKIADKQDDTILDIKLHTQLLEIFRNANIDIFEKHKALYTKILEKIHYFVNKEQIVKEIKKVDIENILDDVTVEKLSNVNKGNKGFYASFSLFFIDEILQKLRAGESYQNSLTQLGYFKKYLDITPYDYLPPLNPSSDDIKWLEKNVKNFKVEHLFYQPLISPNVKRVISILRKLINDLIKKYGKIDEIIIETARELNTKTEEEQIKDSQANSRKEIKEAEKLLEAYKYESTNKNIERTILYIEQRAKCLYSGNPMTLEEALDEIQTEVEHFIPRSKIWINLNKNKILVFKKHNQNKIDKHPIIYLKSKTAWEDFQHRVNEHISNKSKVFWLTNEDNINKNWEKGNLEYKFLNDNKSASKIIANYLEHYLFPKQNKHGKGWETNSNIIRVTGKAISELKRLWGIDKIQPKNEDDKKDRDTNYHHTIDALVISLLNQSSKKALNDFFKQNEKGLKIEVILENLRISFPKTKDGMSLVDFVKEKIRKYENDEIYVCHMMKKRDNIVGFKNGNIKLYWDKEKEIFCQIDKKEVNLKSILLKKEGQNIKERTDKEVEVKIDELITFLNLPKQNNIKEALLDYKEKLLQAKTKLGNIEKQIRILEKDKEFLNTIENKQIELLLKEKEAQIYLLNEPCYFLTKKKQKQIIRNIAIKSKNTSKVDTIIIIDKMRTNRLRRLTKVTYDEIKNNKIPFVAKLNDSTLNLNLFNTIKGQVIGLNYFSSIKGDIKTKIDNSKICLIENFENKITISKGDLIEIEHIQKRTKKYYVFNGGGNITNGNNKIELKSINKKNNKRLFVTLNINNIARKIFMNYTGVISYVDFKK